MKGGFGRGNRRGRRHQARPSLLALEDRRLLSTFNVTSAANDGGVGTLRWAVAQANSDTSPSTINIEDLQGQNITLTQGALTLSNAAQPITISFSVDPATVTVNANMASRVFVVSPNVTATISGLTITGGATTDVGGGILNNGTLTLRDCTVFGNSSGNGGGGLYNAAGSVTIQDCAFNSNSAGAVASNVAGQGYGGAVQTFGGSITVSGTSFTANQAVEGGAIANNGATLTISRSSFNANVASSSLYTARGGAILNQGDLNVDASTFRWNHADNNGGAIANTGQAHVQRSTFQSNNAITTAHSASGGGIDNGNSGTLDLNAVILDGNHADSTGGGLSNEGTCTVKASTFSGNMTDPAQGSGGGVSNADGVLTIINSTVAGNSAGYGGGLYTTGGTLSSSNSTISGNSARSSGGGLYNDGPTATLTNTIIAGNTRNGGTVDDVAVASELHPVTGTHNLIGSGGSGGLENGVQGNIVLTRLDNLGLLPLADRGGPTPTMALTVGSPAIAAGTAVTGITTDQRGLPLDSPSPDIGAFQAQPHELVRLEFRSIANPSIVFGTPHASFSGTITSGAGAPVGQSVAVSLAGVTQFAAVQADGSFSTSFDTAALPASATPYKVSYSYTGGGAFPAVTATGNLTISRLPPPPIVPVEPASRAAVQLVFTPYAVMRKRHRKLAWIDLSTFVIPLVPNRGAPNGTIRYMIRRRTIGTVTLNRGWASLRVKSNTVLNKPLTIIYSGDANFLADMTTTPKLRRKMLRNS